MAPVISERSAYFCFGPPDNPRVKIIRNMHGISVTKLESKIRYISAVKKNQGKKKLKSLEMKIKYGIMLELSNRQRCASQKMSGFCPSASCCSYALWASLSSCDSTSTGESIPA